VVASICSITQLLHGDATAVAMAPVAQQFRTVITRLQALVWPPVCAACGNSIEPDTGELCAGCAREMAAYVGASYCLGCGEERPLELLIDHRCGHCREQGSKFMAFIRVGPYDGPLRSLILQFKHRKTLDRLLGGWMSDAFGRWDIQPSVDIWTGVPSPFLRRMQRGFQPTQLLAREIARRTSRPFKPVLAMARYVPPFHHGMSPTLRRKAIQGAFRTISPADIDGRVIGLVDDVCTTGATLDEGRRILRKAGAKGVVAVVLARR